MKHNVSYSSLMLFESSPLQYYFQNISGIKKDSTNIYGQLGTAIHNSIESYIKGESASEKYQKELKKIGDVSVGMFGEKIKIEMYDKCLERGIEIIDIWRNGERKLLPEKEIIFQKNVDGKPVTIKGYIDLIAIDDREITIHDWKTNSNLPNDAFLNQQIFYVYLIKNSLGKATPEKPIRCLWYMLKNGNIITHKITEEHIIKLENRIDEMVRNIRKWGKDINNYEPGDWNNIFNAYKEECEKEVDRRTNKIQTNSNMLDVIIEKNNLIIQNLVDTKLIRGLDLKFSYFVDGYHFSELYKKRIWDGKTHVFSVKKKSIPLGLKKEFEKFLKEYNERFNTNYEINYIDKRDKEVMNKKYKTVFKPQPFELRDYQNEAIEIFLKEKIGIINLPTGVGKSVIIGEVLKLINKRSLIIVSRLELLKQLKEDIEFWTGCEVGKISQGNLDISKQFTIASIQSIQAILKRKNEESKELLVYLYNLPFIVFDEAHLVRDANSYKVISKFCINAEFILGTTATDWRNDCHTLLMNALVGSTIYKKTPQEMIEAGYILPTKCYFINSVCDGSGAYHDAYDMNIVYNHYRNQYVIDICKKYKNDFKILIITKLIKHGESLNNAIRDSYLITSSTKKDDREKFFKEFKEKDGVVLIASAGIMGTGINIPALDVIINVGAHKSDVLSVQIVGRSKRVYGKKKFGYYFDFYDLDKSFFEDGSIQRINILKEFGNEIIIINDVKEAELT